MNTALRTAPHYFVIDSIGGMNETYSETTCRRIEDVVAPEYGKAMVEEYIDQWVHERTEYLEEAIAETGVTCKLPVRYNLEECPRGGWVKLTPEFDKSLVWNEFMDEIGFHTLFIQVYDGTMLGDSVVVYDQMDDRVRTITHKSTAIRMAEECISIEVDSIKARLYGDRERGYDPKYYMSNMVHAYDSLADVVRCLEFPQGCMVDLDDVCLHFFPVRAMKVMTYNGNNVIITL